MKKIIIISLLLFINFSMSSQNIGLKTGLSISNFNKINDFDNTSSRIGISFGVISEYGQSNIRFSPEIMFNQKGSKEQIHLSTLNLALNTNFYFNDEISLNIGPSIGYLLSGQNKNSENWMIIDDWTSWNRLEYSGNFGLSYKLNDLLTLEYMYVLGLSSYKSASNLKNFSSNLRVSYIFNY